MTTAVLFDLEDTLIQTPWSNFQHVLEYRSETRKKLLELGIPANVLEGTERATIMRNRASEYIEGDFTKVETEKFYQEMEKFVIRYELDSAKKSKLFPETMPTLENLKKLDLKMGLVTNTSMEAVNIAFQLHKMKSYFDVVVTRERVKKLKPDPEGILLAVNALSVKSFFMAGDLLFDVLAAKNANGTSIFVKRKNNQEEVDPPADYVVESLSEIPAIVQKAMRMHYA